MVIMVSITSDLRMRWGKVVRRRAGGWKGGTIRVYCGGEEGQGGEQRRVMGVCYKESESDAKGKRGR